MTTKKCSKCNEVKPVSEFAKRKDSKDGYRNDCKVCKVKREREAYQKNKDARKQVINEYRKHPIVILRRRITNNINKSFKRFNVPRTKECIDILGCDLDFFVEYIKDKFNDTVSLDNIKNWELDHIIPVSSAKNTWEMECLNHYTNFQPLLAKTNQQKADKYCEKEKEMFLHLFN